MRSELSIDDKRTPGIMISDQNLKIRVLETLEDLEGLRPQWEKLLAGYPQASTFCTWEWLVPWWRAFGAEQRLHVLAVENSSSELIALAPLCWVKRKTLGKEWKVLRLMGDGSGDSDNLDFPVLSGFESTFASMLLDHLNNLNERNNRWDLSEFNLMPRNSVGENYILPHLQELGWPYVLSDLPKRIIDLPETWDEYLRGLSQNERRNILRYRKRLEKQYKVEVVRCSQQDELPTYLNYLFELHQKAWHSRNERGTFESIARRGFYLELSKELLARRQLEFWLLQLDDQFVAAEFDFRYGSTVYALQQAFALDRPEDRPGSVLRGYVLQKIIAAGARQYDFLAGEDSYKDRWYPRKDNYSNIRFARPFSAGSIFLHTALAAERSKAWLRAKLPRRAWSFLHNLKPSSIRKDRSHDLRKAKSSTTSSS